MAIKVCLDAGHYGKYNRSPVVRTYYESDMTWKLHLLLKKELEGYGIEVITTRKDQKTDKALYARGYMSKGCDLFMSLHSNATDKGESIDYPIVYRAMDNRNNADELALQLAKLIEKLMGTRQKGKTATRKASSGNEYYGVLRGARAAGCKLYYLVEHSFHTNKRATEWLLNEANLRVLAQEEAKLIAEYYGLKKKEINRESKAGIKAGDTVKLKASAIQWDGKAIRSDYKGKEYKVKSVDSKGRAVLTIDNIIIYAVDVKYLILKDVKTIDRKEGKGYLVKVTANVLNIRNGPGTSYKINGQIKDKGTYTIVETKGTWGKLKSGVGWISLKYTKKV